MENTENFGEERAKKISFATLAERLPTSTVLMEKEKIIKFDWI